MKDKYQEIQELVEKLERKGIDNFQIFPEEKRLILFKQKDFEKLLEDLTPSITSENNPPTLNGYEVLLEVHEK